MISVKKIFYKTGIIVLGTYPATPSKLLIRIILDRYIN